MVIITRNLRERTSIDNYAGSSREGISSADFAPDSHTAAGFSNRYPPPPRLQVFQAFLAALGIFHLTSLHLLNSSWGVLFRTCCGLSANCTQSACSISGCGHSTVRKLFTTPNFSLNQVAFDSCLLYKVDHWLLSWGRDCL